MQLAFNGNELSEERWALLRSFLLGERVRTSDLRRAGLGGIKEPLSERNAEHVLTTALNGLYAARGRGTLLLFDENEPSFRLRHTRVPRAAQLAANHIRRFIDAAATGHLQGVAAVFGVLNEFLEDCNLVYPALGQRLEMSHKAGQKASWRWPVLRLDQVNTIEHPDEFVAAACERYGEIAAELGLPQHVVTELLVRLERDGRQVVESNAGWAFRRPLAKVLATSLLDALSEEGVL